MTATAIVIAGAFFVGLALGMWWGIAIACDDPDPEIHLGRARRALARRGEKGGGE